MSLLLDALRRAEEARRAKEGSTPAAPAEASFTVDKINRAPPAIESRASELAVEEPVATLSEYLSLDKMEDTPPPVEFLVDAVSAPNPQPVSASPPDELALASSPARAREDLSTFAARVRARASAPASTLALEEAPITHAGSAEKMRAPEPAADPALVRNPLLSAAPQEVAQRDAARNLFAAKQPTAPAAKNRSKLKWIIPALASTFVLLGAGSWYVWNEINRFSKPMVARNVAPPAALPQAVSTTGQIGGKTLPTDSASGTKQAETPIPPLLPPPALEAATPKPTAVSATERALTAREIVAKKIREAPAAKDATVGLKLARSINPPRLNPDLVTAYQSLAGGDYAGAQSLYAKLVLAEPMNVDAQLGLATAAARNGDKSLATQSYRQVLVLDPRNGLALMGLVALNEGAQSATLEVELKTLIGRNPEAAPLHFALGNSYANERRWTEAQQAYFEAFRIDPANPDYLFNLAVSLDQLRQARLALDYYRKAEAIAMAGGGGQFDRGTIAKRIRELGVETARSN